MTRHSRTARLLGALVLAALTAAPLLAAGKKGRAVLHPNITKTTVTGTVTDAVTGLPLKGAIVASSETGAVTDDAGHYSLTCVLTADITASRFGYVPVKKPVNAAQIDFALPLTPSVTVKLTSGQTVVFDFDSTKFGYADVFQYVSGIGISLCKPGGEQWSPLKDEIAKITGPAHPITDDSCCTRGPVTAIGVQPKNGPAVTASIVDSCFGITYDILGVERTTITPKYIHLSDVSEVVFP